MSYSIIVLSLTEFYYHFNDKFESISIKYRIPAADKEYLYDWIVRETLSNILSVRYAGLQEHYRHDIYKCVYDDLGDISYMYVFNQLRMHKLMFLRGEKIKTMVTGDSLFIARGVMADVRF